jgi:glycosyltransferase involved in cell wall biosynthesis
VVVGLDQLFSATTEQVALQSKTSSIPNDAQKSDIPASLLRDPCHLEILVPARDEALRLPQTLMHTVQYLEMQPYSSSVVVIDNGSVDHTSDLASRPWSDSVPVHLVGCAQPGKGAAVRRGFLTSRASFVGYMDADLATPIETLDVVMPLLKEFQVVIGSRYINGAALAKRQPVHRTASSMAFRAVTRLVMSGFTDTQCGFKFMAGELARTVARQLCIDGFAFDVELLKAVVDMGLSIKEIPVVWSDQEGSTLRALRDGVRATADVVQLARRGSASCPL